MAKYVLSYRVPADYTPGPEVGDEWRARLGGTGSSLVDFGSAVSDYTALGEVGGSGSRLAGYSVVSAKGLESAVTLAKGCPAVLIGGGVEIGPAMEEEA